MIINTNICVCICICICVKIGRYQGWVRSWDAERERDKGENETKVENNEKKNKKLVEGSFFNSLARRSGVRVSSQ